MKLRLGTRGTELAIARTNQVAKQLEELGHEVEVVPVTTAEPDTNHMHDGLSFKGQFAAELRQALRDGKVDAVVHSTKDLPIGEQRQPDLVIAAVPHRDDWRDALVSRNRLPLAALPAKARVGVTSLRRIAQIRRIRPDLTFVDIGGTMQERLARIQPGDLDAVVLSASALQRTGNIELVAEFLDILPAPGQGAKSIECRVGDTEVQNALGAIEHEETRIAVAAERDVMYRLGVDYWAPVAALVSRRAILNMKTMAASVDGEHYIRLEIGMPTSLLHAKRTGQRMAEAFMERNVKEFLSPEVLANVKFSKEHDDETGTLDEMGADAPHLLLPRQEGQLSASFREEGVSVDTAPLQIAYVLEDAQNVMDKADWLLFPSAHTVWALRELGWKIPADKKIAAIGSTTKQVLEEWDLEVTLSPDGTASSKRLLDLVDEGNGHVVIPGSDDLSSRLIDGFASKGYTAEHMPVYQMRDIEEVADWVLEGWNKGRYHAILLTSPSVAQSYLNLMPKNDDVAVYAWDEDTAKMLRDGGVTVADVAKSKDADGVRQLAESIKAYAKK